MLEQFFDDEPVVQEEESSTPNTIQQRTKERTHELIGEVEGLFDGYINDWREKKNYAFLFNIGIKPMHARVIIKFCHKKIDEYNSAMVSKDEQVKEAYSCFTKPQMKKIVTWWESIIVDCNRLIEDGKVLSRMKREKNARKKGLDIRKKK
ncbi:hypothetical protein UFOVP250_116 [uncultured Caudovirales phage]|uniref:Uncharacterized protein n=1 Tax=uncultured Caudovirales phage TaxID=2100421 RepID=A0A6J5LF43_9CAUD|nr:hypothetical protein UFOVP250_116 [uncultured Caudovirales phage]